MVSTGTTTNYAGNYVYENDALQFFNTAEGYFEPSSPPSGALEGAYVYQYKDHLGNIRLSYSDANHDGSITASTEIKEENNYYPFGLKHKGYNNVQNGRDHKFGFGNKEEQDELGLGWIDITARNYDPALGRWMNVDPLASKYYNISPYVYVSDNPLLYIDPDGKEIIVANKVDQGAVLKMINSKALGVFAFNKSGKLYLAKVGGDATKYSTYYQKQLVAAINDKEKINVSIGQTFQDRGKTKNVDNDAGGGVTNVKTIITTDTATGVKTVTKAADVTISGNPNNDLKDTSGNKLTDAPADILAHELVGHAIPFITKPDTGNAVDNENKVRKETNSPERALEPDHKEKHT